MAPNPLRATTTRIDVFAVRQWPGNGADLDFRGVLEGCTAAIVAAAPIEGTLLKEHGEESVANPPVREAFLKRRVRSGRKGAAVLPTLVRARGRAPLATFSPVRHRT